MLCKVAVLKSSPGLPGTVTTPGLVGCLYCLCEPRVRSKYQPSPSRSLRTSRTFIGLPQIDSIYATLPSACNWNKRQSLAAHGGRKTITKARKDEKVKKAGGAISRRSHEADGITSGAFAVRGEGD